MPISSTSNTFRLFINSTFSEFVAEREALQRRVLRVGRTTGRGKKSTSNRPRLPMKDIWLYPLQRDFAAVLSR